MMRLGRVRSPRFADQRGFTLLLVLVAVVVLGLVAGITGRIWSSLAQKEREEELLFRGDQYRRAIESYRSTKQGGSTGAYPASVDDLLRDKRTPQVRRHLRSAYKDPFTGEDFVLIGAGGQVNVGGQIGPGGQLAGLGQAAGSGTGKTIGGFKGVRSTSTLKPFKEDGFPKEYETFMGATSYAAWEFVFDSAKAQQQQTSTSTPVAPGTSTPFKSKP